VRERVDGELFVEDDLLALAPRACLAGCLLLQRSQHLLRCDRQLRDPDADRVVTAAAMAGGCGLFAISEMPLAPYGPSADGFSMRIVVTLGRFSMPGAT
jgi:hypothetical protein